jgi:hypothetical protein
MKRLLLSMVFTATYLGGYVEAQTKVVRIILSANPDYERKPNENIAKCVATAVPHRARVTSGQPLTWTVENDTGSGWPCNYYQPSQMQVDVKEKGLFDSAIVNEKMKSPNKVEGKVNGKGKRRKYKILFEDKLAQDPELDIDGDGALDPITP